MLISNIKFFKKNYLNIFPNKKHFKNNICLKHFLYIKKLILKYEQKILFSTYKYVFRAAVFAVVDKFKKNYKL